MKEGTIEKHLKRMTVLVVVISLVILGAGGIVTLSLNRVRQEGIDNRIQGEVESYKEDLEQKIQTDFQIVYTLAAFLEFNQGLDKENFSRGLLESNNHNNFVRMGYFSKNGRGVRVTRGKDMEIDVTLEEISPCMQEIVRSAWEGAEAFSGISYDEKLEKDVIGYAVPVYRNGEIIGALVATEAADSLREMLNGETIFAGNGYIRLVDSQGNYVLPYEEDSVFSGDYFSAEEKERIEETLQEGGNCFTSVRYNGNLFRIYIAATDIRDWNLFGIESVNEVNRFTSQMILITRIAFSLVLAVVILLVFYGYRALKKKNRELIQYAYYDPLTGAYNSEKFQQELTEVMKGQEAWALAGMNIRQFKFINEIFGRNQADSLLCHVKEAMENNMEEGEYFCRNSADMFLMLLKTSDKKIIQERIRKIMGDISAFSANWRRNYEIQMYCGISLIPAGGKKDTATMQTTHTMFALEKARTLPRNSIWFYDLKLHQEEILQNYVESHMNQALEAGEFKMYLQPKFELKTGKLVGAETLVRWIPEDGKVIYPGQFIPIFERNGFCAALDMYMTEQVCRQLRRWRDENGQVVPVSVNQSKILFYEADYVERMEKLIKKYQVPAEWITLEILEGLAMENIDKLNQVILRLKKIGFRISMDDFGSGYSSLNILGNLRIDELKLDKGFFKELEGADRRRQTIIIEHIIEISKSLKISTVAEGIETEGDQQMVRDLDCDYGQGYYYCRPVPVEEFNEKYMKKGEA
ncbi:MAG TPA: EAL domain-containing protein [Candidatus Blautia pullistercoris]|uniref:EAL domain-containing protein n=1 Tax=Candidatus Blautia pullistercoris TaxID=2838499 RepID=A0A9D2ANC1_9FIRM|nr:EAL domain-containing protein [Candidatus Blautia pullistercoris]